MPPIFLEISLLFAVDKWLHSMVVERVWLDQVNYVEFVNNVLTRVSSPEVEPLTLLGRCTVIEFQLQVIFKFSDLSCSV